MLRSRGGPSALYLHIPFCAQKCRYCAFHSLSNWTPIEVRRITDRILDDIDTLAPLMSSIRTLYIGGGTPTILAPRRLSALIDRPRSHGASPVEITVEANPESVSREMLETLAAAGVTRLSVGVQTGEASAARVLGRRPTPIGEIERIRGWWPAHLSTDLIHGAPASTSAGFLRTLSMLLDLGVDHLSLYGLSVEEGTPLARDVADGTVSVTDDSDSWSSAMHTLQAAGFHRYEVSSFARPGAECIHNLAYWRGENYIGLGPSAVSTLCETAHGTDTVRYTQPVDHDAFLHRGDVFDCDHELLTSAQLRLEYLMLGLRTGEGISSTRLSAECPEEEWDRLQTVFGDLEDEGLVRVQGDAIRATGRGMDLLNRVLVELM